MRKYILFIFKIIIKFYQYGLSPLLGRNCRYEPTCSRYALEALKIHGVYHGGWLFLKRFASCHPFTQMEGGYRFDPVPPCRCDKYKKIK